MEVIHISSIPRSGPLKRALERYDAAQRMAKNWKILRATDLDKQDKWDGRPIAKVIYIKAVKYKRDGWPWFKPKG